RSDRPPTISSARAWHSPRTASSIPIWNGWLSVSRPRAAAQAHRWKCTSADASCLETRCACAAVRPRDPRLGNSLQRDVAPVVDADLADRRRIERRCVVDERIEATERLHRLLDERRQLADIEEVRLDQRNRIGANVIELGLQETRFPGGSAEVEHDRCTCLV